MTSFASSQAHSTIRTSHRACRLIIQSRLENGQCTRHYTVMCCTRWKIPTYISASTTIMILNVAPKSTIPILWVDLYATEVDIILADGRARRSLSPFECILEHSIIQGFTTNAVRAVIVLVDRFWIIHMQKEWHIV